jgi:dissimilatory sulfite reductase (desulfoviridin) alpha/beta subunit
MNYRNHPLGPGKGTTVSPGPVNCPKKSKAVDEILARLEQAVPEAPKPLKPRLMCCPKACPEADTND